MEKNDGMNSKQKNTRDDFEKVDKATYTWSNGKRSQQVPIDGFILKEKALVFDFWFLVEQVEEKVVWFVFFVSLLVPLPLCFLIKFIF